MSAEYNSIWGRSNLIHLFDPISSLGFRVQKLEFKRYEDGSYKWECECLVSNKGIRTAANSTVKKDAKKYAAYLALCAEFDLYNEYED